jgi:putative spermidine/putrescine transport system permease protein
VAQPVTRRSGRTDPLWLAIPALTIILGIFVAPVVLSGVRSFSEPHLGFQNYEWFFTDGGALRNFRSTILMAVLTTLTCLCLAYPFAYLMTVSSKRTKGFLIVLVIIPYWTSIMVRALAWISILQQSGAANEVFSWLGMGPFELMRNRLGVLIGMSQILLPFMILPLYTAMQSIDLRLVTAATSLGATRGQAFFKVFLPLSSPGIISGSVLVFVQSLGFYLIPALLGSPRDAMISQQIYTQVAVLLNWGHGGAISMVLLVFTLLAFGLTGILLRRFNRRFARSS